MGIEPTWSAWKAEVLPLNYTRILRSQECVFSKRLSILQQERGLVYNKFYGLCRRCTCKVIAGYVEAVRSLLPACRSLSNDGYYLVSRKSTDDIVFGIGSLSYSQELTLSYCCIHDSGLAELSLCPCNLD